VTQVTWDHLRTHHRIERGWLMKLKHTAVAALALALVVGPCVGAAFAAGAKVADVEVTASSLAVRPLLDSDGLSVTVSGPNGVVLSRAFGGDESPVLVFADAQGAPLGDGAYTYEITLHARVDASAKAGLAAAREAQDTGAAPRSEAPALVERGSFRISGGVVYTAGAVEPTPTSGRRAPSASGGGDAPVPPTPDDQVIADDLIVQGSICAGFDCVVNENFGFDTIRLKENNLRIKFEDTSAGTFPTNDWELTANDSASGGASRFSITDVDGGKTPFTVTAGAATGSIFVDSTGRVGLRTTTPVLDLHIKTGNTPAARLEQDGSSGFTAQTWDVAGNEANFFVRDVTSGSRLPLRIRPGAPTSSIDVAASGNVGVGTASPSSALHVKRTDGTAKLTIEEGNTTADRVLMVLQNSAPNNKSRFLIQSGTGSSGIWTFDNNGQTLDSFSITRVGAASNAFTLTSAGNLTIAGSLTQGSDRNAKDDIVDVDEHAILSKVAALPIATWRYKTDTAKHMGPMAQDFSAAFGLGQDDRHIGVGDMGGVALAAIKALNEVVASKDAELKALQQHNAELAARLAAIEAALAAQQR
jgi:hypothetical protein